MNLKLRRKIHLNKSQAAMAREIGITAGHLSRIERGMIAPSCTLAPKIAKAYKVKKQDVWLAQEVL